MNHAEDEALRQRLADENLARATRQPPQPRFGYAPPERDSNPLPVSRAPRELPKPEPMWQQRPVDTSRSYVSGRTKRRIAWLVLGVIVVVFAALWLALGGAR